MKLGKKNVTELYLELEREREVRQDFIADTRNITFSTKSSVSMIQLALKNDVMSYRVSELAHRQLAERLQIPFKYYERMRAEYPKLLDDNINGWLYKNPEKRLLRTLDGRLRAFLSSRYRRLDNLELADHILPIIGQMRGCEIASCDITSTHLYMKVINKTLKTEVIPGDIVQAGFIISNSEVGLGAVKVEPLIYRLVCKNGMICKDYAHKKYHTGRQVEDTENAYELYSDETLAADDKAYFMKVQDIVSVAVDESKFLLTVDKMRKAREESTGSNPIETVELLGDRYILNKNERASILRHFALNHDFSKYGLVNAVTRSAQDNNDYNRATDLERLGGIILEEKLADNSIKKVIENKIENFPAIAA